MSKKWESGSQAGSAYKVVCYLLLFTSASMLQHQQWHQLLQESNLLLVLHPFCIRCAVLTLLTRLLWSWSWGNWSLGVCNVKPLAISPVISEV